MTPRQKDSHKNRIDSSQSNEREEMMMDAESLIQSLENELANLKIRLTEETEKSEKNFDSWRRAEADFSNYRKRTEQEKNEIYHSATCSVVLVMLPVLDDLERALASVPTESDKLPWVEGVRLICKKLRLSLESLGLEEVCATGQPFDPNLHEAVSQMEGEEGAVMSELQKGYKIKNKLIRPSRVIVGSGLKKDEISNS